MDKRRLHYYERELRYIRELGGEFARAFPKIAGRLGLSVGASDDPHVERLFQGYSLLAARVHEQIDGEFGAFTEGMLERVYPSYLGPTPSMVVVQLDPDMKQGSLDRGYEVERGTALHARSALRRGAVCEYRTGHPVRLWPVQVESARYTVVLQDLADLRIPMRAPVKALFHVRLRTTGGQPFSRLGLRSLPLYLAGADELSGQLYEALVAHSGALVMRWDESNPKNTKTHRQAVCSNAACPIRPLGFDDAEALLPPGPPALRGYRLLQEYFALPTRFHFVELCGLEEAVTRCGSDTLDVYIPLRTYDPALEGAIPAERLRLHATPAINLFPRICHLPAPNGHGEQAVILPDRARPLDFEVHSVQRVAATEPGSTRECELPQSSVPRASAARASELASYTLHRRPRVVTYEEQLQKPSTAQYAGDDVLIQLDSAPGALRLTSRSQLRVTALCTNRDLLMLPMLPNASQAQSFTLASGAPVSAIHCIAAPTLPRSNQLQGQRVWQLISTLSPNYLSLDERQGGEAMRELLDIHSQLGDPQLRREVEGIRSVVASPVVGPLPGPGPQQFTRGLEVKVVCEERAFAAHRAFTLAAVLSELFASHATGHSFTQTVLVTPERGEVYRWPAVAGVRPTL